MMKNKVEKAAKVIDNYLTCKDFNSYVILNYEDGSCFKLQYAFYIKLVDYIVIFTEHLGYFIYHKNEVDSIRQINYKLKSQEEIDRLNKLAKSML